MSAIYILWLREVKRYSRSRAQIVASLGQPLLYLLALGFGMGPVFEKAGHGSYLQFVAPGVIGMSVLFSSIFSGIGLLWIASSASSRKRWWRRCPGCTS
jgi:ABC-2 type transport system permease protein